MFTRRTLLASAAFTPIVAFPVPSVSRVLWQVPATPAAAPLVEVVWQADGGPDFRLGEPTFVAMATDGQVWVADGKNGRFVIFSPQGTVQEAWGTAGSGEGEFTFVCAPTIVFGAVAFAATGGFYVADAGNQRIQQFGPDRTFIRSWGSKGTKDDQFLCPASLIVDENGRVYISDEGWGRVKVFERDGTWLATWSGLMTPEGLAVAADGTIWVADFGGSVAAFSPDGQRLQTWKNTDASAPSALHPTSVVIDAQGRVFAADWDGHRILVFTPDGALLGSWGERGPAAGQFQNPFGITLDGTGAIYVTDHGHGVQKFRLLPPLISDGTPGPG